MRFITTAALIVAAGAVAVPKPVEKVARDAIASPDAAPVHAINNAADLLSLRRRTIESEIAISTTISEVPTSSPTTFITEATTPSMSTPASTEATPSITDAPTLEQVTGALAVSVSTCSPSSVCVRARSCGVMYGACYDKNYCDGNTSPFSIPTCLPTPTAAPAL